MDILVLPRILCYYLFYYYGPIRQQNDTINKINQLTDSLPL